MKRVDRKRVAEIAQVLADTVRRSAEPVLPSMRELSRRLQVDTHLVMHACRLLRQQKVISYRRGQRMRVVGRAADTLSIAPVKTPSSQHLFTRLRAAILQGDFVRGQVLPKRQFLAAKEGVSPSTVAAACRKLVRERLAYRRGRQYVVGSDLGEVIPGGPGAMPVIVVVQPKDRFWSHMRTSDLGGAVKLFSHEAETGRIRLVSWSASCGTSSALELDGKRMSPIELTEAFGTNCAGALVVGERDLYSRFDALVGDLVACRKPVVWFDRLDHGGVGGHPRELVRCTFSEERYTTEALEHLVNNGHRRVGFVGLFHHRPQWQVRRKELLETAAARHRACVVSYDKVAFGLYRSEVPRIADTIDAAWRSGSPHCRKLIKLLSGAVTGQRPSRRAFGKIAQFLHDWPDTWDRSTPPALRVGFLFELIPLLLDRDITGLIIARDGDAAGVLQALRLIGIKVPAEISLVSYDNAFDTTVLPVDTVDRGAEGLGYAAFHRIVGDIPLGAKREGVVTAVPRVLVRGSVRRVP